MCIKILAYVERRMGIVEVLKIHITCKHKNWWLKVLRTNNSTLRLRSSYDTVGSFSCIMLKISFGVHPGRLAKRWPYSPSR